jgi:hypothetical protein
MCRNKVSLAFGLAVFGKPLGHFGWFNLYDHW